MKHSGALVAVIILMIISCSHNPSEDDYRRFSGGVQLYFEGDAAGALKVFEELHSEFPDFKENTRLYARCLFFTGNEKKAAAVWETFDLLKDPDLDTVKTLSAWYLENHRTDMALPLLDKGLIISSEDPLLLFLKARACIADGDLEQAMSLLLSGLTLMEKQIVIPLELARIYNSFGMQSESNELLLRYSQFLPADHPLQAAVEQLRKSIISDSEL